MGFLAAFTLVTVLFLFIHISRTCQTWNQLEKMKVAGFSRRRKSRIQSIHVNLLLFNAWCLLFGTPVYICFAVHAVKTVKDCRVLHALAVLNFSGTNFFLYRLLNAKSRLVDIMDDHHLKHRVLWWILHMGTPFVWVVTAIPGVSRKALRTVDGVHGLCVDEVHIAILIVALVADAVVSVACIGLFIAPLLSGVEEFSTLTRSREIRKAVAKRNLLFSAGTIGFTLAVMIFFAVSVANHGFLVMDSALTVMLIDLTVKVVCVNLTNSTQYYALAMLDACTCLQNNLLLRRCSSTMELPGDSLGRSSLHISEILERRARRNQETAARRVTQSQTSPRPSDSSAALSTHVPAIRVVAGSAQASSLLSSSDESYVNSGQLSRGVSIQGNEAAAVSPLQSPRALGDSCRSADRQRLYSVRIPSSDQGEAVVHDTKHDENVELADLSSGLGLRRENRTLSPGARARGMTAAEAATIRFV